MSNRILESVKGSLEVENLKISNQITVNEAVKIIRDEYSTFGRPQ